MFFWYPAYFILKISEKILPLLCHSNIARLSFYGVMLPLLNYPSSMSTWVSLGIHMFTLINVESIVLKSYFTRECSYIDEWPFDEMCENFLFCV